jgi:hypothetical protein
MVDITELKKTQEEMARKEAAEMIELLVARGFRGYRSFVSGDETEPV